MQISHYLSKSYIKEKWSHAGFQKYFRNTGWMFGGRIFTLAISFFVGAYIARYLGPANYGLLNYVISFVGLFGFLASFGIDGIISREIIKDPTSKDKLIGTGFFIKIAGSFLTITTVILTAFFTTPDIFTFLLIVLFSLSYVPQAFNIIEVYFQSQVLSKNVVRAQISATLIATILKILVIVLNKGIFWLTLIYVIEAALFALFLLITFKYYGHHFKSLKFDVSIAKSLLKDSWPLMLSTLAIALYMKIDQVMIKNMLNDREVGLYAVAVKLSEFWYFIPGIICGSVFPAIMNAKKININLYKQRIKKLNLLMFIVAFLIALPVSIFAESIIYILFGHDYISASTVLSLYVWAGISVSINLSVNQFLVSENMTKIYFISTMLGAIINILLNLLLIPKIGIIGSAIATTISYTLVTIFIYTLMQFHFKKMQNE